MSTYKIITDSCCDLSVDKLRELNVTAVSLSLMFRGAPRPDAVTDEIKEVYDAMRAGENATTSAANPEDWKAVIEPVLAAGEDALVIAFSSGLSTTYQSAVIAAEDLVEKYPQRKVNVVDSLCASLGQGLLVWYACDKRDEGLSLEELTAWVEDNKLNLCQWFTVDDLYFLKRGGRVSAATALLGTMLKIKPVLHVDQEGHLINVAKFRGRKASIDALASKMEQLQLVGKNDRITICHGDCLEDAQYLAEQLKDKLGVKEVYIGYTGAVIGSHSGPGTLALFFLGKER
ncbi:MAG: DegV family protein [Ruminococcaceae bacterium]|nr:DegV family protein [Oscillospiraceae bacterium]MBQ3215585.1 DegV family protein [Oscillospiraceae bacterium]